MTNVKQATDLGHLQVCDRCLAQGMTANAGGPAIVREVLAKSGLFVRETGTCALCGSYGRVTRYVPTRLDAESSCGNGATANVPPPESWRALNQALEQVVQNISTQADVNVAVVNRVLRLEQQLLELKKQIKG